MESKSYSYLIQNKENRNYPEDFNSENGNYINICFTCDNQFLGYKRRNLCKKCSNLNKEKIK